MGNQGSSPHEPLDRAQVQNNPDLKMKSSVRSSFRRSRTGGTGALSPPRAGMERLRRSFRESFRRRKGGEPPESARPHQWHADEAAVRAGTCTFHVKYLGCVEVFESRGMQVCEEAIKVLRNSRRRPVRAVLHVSGDGLRVVEEETKGLIVDQTIEKVSFCAPDRNHERGFSYICRDGTTRRWMCHGFLASRDSGERLSHAVGCAFAACLERKQRRDKECAVSMSIDAASHAFTRQGSFRKSALNPSRRASEADASIILPPAHTNPFTNTPVTRNVITPSRRASEADAPPPPAPRAAHNPFAVERPHAAPHLLERQGSFRGFAHLNNSGILDSEICDSRYDVFRCDRDYNLTGKSTGGGVMLCVRREFGAFVRSEWSCSPTETLWVTIPARCLKATSDLHIAVAYCHDIDGLSYDDLVQVLDAHFKPKQCSFADKAKFYGATRNPGESLGEWAARLRGLASFCNFGTALESTLLDRFVLGLGMGPERDRLFEQDSSDLTFAKALEIAERAECAREAKALVTNGAGVVIQQEPVYRVASERGGAPRRPPPRAAPAAAAPGDQRDQHVSRCSVCGLKNHSELKCRFKSFKCQKCGVKGHLRKMCKLRVNNIETEENDSTCEDCKECSLFNMSEQWKHCWPE
ncbi:unnamed protein product [Plutella xylostella]|uniref:(diamondback moth) hypothetical protein n=1 Tax=Plutella xylostella TaxID=51655 RepID=A0A8S4EUR4_PLUXY|nr:unnamed protein product [Plutella xylostella]